MGGVRPKGVSECTDGDGECEREVGEVGEVGWWRRERPKGVSDCTEGGLGLGVGLGFRVRV